MIPATTADLTLARRWIVRVIVVAFSVAALLGVIVVLAGGRFGEVEGRVLATTCLMGAIGVAFLCFLSTAGRRWWFLGAAGAAVAAIPSAILLWMIWADGSPSSGVLRALAIGLVWTWTLCQICLLSVVLDLTRREVLRRLLLATVMIALIVAVVSSGLIAVESFPGDWVLRILIVLIILDALGTITLPPIALLLGRSAAQQPALAGIAIRLQPESASRAQHYATAHGISVDDVVNQAVEQFTRAAPPPR